MTSNNVKQGSRYMGLTQHEVDMDGVRLPEDPDESAKKIYYNERPFPTWQLADWGAEPEKRKEYYRDRASRQSDD